MTKVRTTKDNETVQAVARALTILETMAKEGASLSLTDLAQKVGLKLTTVHRLLATLVGHGFAEQDRTTSHYRLGIKAFEVGNAAHYAMDLRTTARPYLQDLVEKLNETVNLSVLDQGEVVYIDQLESTNIVIVKMFARVGSRGPAYCTGSGKVLLAGLDDTKLLPLLDQMRLVPFTAATITDRERLLEELRRIREQGFALDRGERDDGVFCVAAPIRNFEDRVVAAVSVSGPTARMPENEVGKRFIPTVTETAAGISANLGYKSRPAITIGRRW